MKLNIDVKVTFNPKSKVREINTVTKSAASCPGGGGCGRGATINVGCCFLLWVIAGRRSHLPAPFISQGGILSKTVSVGLRGVAFRRKGWGEHWGKIAGSADR